MHPRPHRPEEECGQGPLGNRRAQAARADRSRRDLGPLDRHGSGAGRGVRVARRRARPRRLRFPFENFVRLHEAGLLALVVPERLGGGGAGLARATEVVGTIARGEPSTALVLAMQYVQHKTVVGSGGFPAPLADRLGREAVAGVSLLNALRAEPELGTPARGGLPAAVATRTAAGGWRLTGRKIYVTGAPILAW